WRRNRGTSADAPARNQRLGHRHRIVEGACRMAEQALNAVEGKRRARVGAKPRPAVMPVLSDGMAHLTQPVLDVDADLFGDFPQHRLASLAAGAAHGLLAPGCPIVPNRPMRSIVDIVMSRGIVDVRQSGRDGLGTKTAA